MKLTPIAQATGNTVPQPLNSQPPAEPVIFTAEEARRGYAMRGNTQHYCCYGMYCEAGHTSDCRYAPGVSGLDGQTFSPSEADGAERGRA